MNLGRRMDIRAKKALSEGEVTAPESIRAQVGNCAECNSGISTHGYELILETSQSENPEPQDKLFKSIVLCENCYHDFSERGFLLKTISEVGCVVNIIGLILAVVGGIVKNDILIGLGVALVIVPSLARYPANQKSQRRRSDFLKKHFPHALDAKNVNSPSPWWMNSSALCVPSALAIVVHAGSEIHQISTDELKKILNGTVTSWSEIGGSDRKINLYLPVSPWREWSLIKQKFLAGAELGAHQTLENPLEVLGKLQQDVDGLGFISMAHFDLFKDQIKVLSLDGEKCVNDNPKYPLWIMPKLFPATELSS